MYQYSVLFCDSVIVIGVVPPEVPLFSKQNQEYVCVKTRISWKLLGKSNYSSYKSIHAIYNKTPFLVLNTRGGAYQKESTCTVRMCMCAAVCLGARGGGGLRDLSTPSSIVAPIVAAMLFNMCLS